MKLEKYVERVCSQYRAKDALLAFLDYIMEGTLLACGNNLVGFILVEQGASPG